VSQTQAPPAPASAPAARQHEEADDSVYETPAPAQPIDWATPSSAAQDALGDLAAVQRAERRAARRKGLPVGPVMVAAANGTVMALTGAYQAGGVAGIAGAGALTLGSAVAVIAKRRATIRGRAAQRSLSQPAARAGAGWSGRTAGGPGVGSWSAGNRSAGLSGRTGAGSGRGATRDGWSLPRPSGAQAGYGSVGTTGRGTPGAGNGRGGARAEQLSRISDRRTGGTGRLADTKAGRGRAGLLSRFLGNRVAHTKADWKDQQAKRRQLAVAAGRLGKKTAAVGWEKTKPARAKTAAVLRRQAVRARGAVWDGTVAVTRGVVTGLFRWNWRAGWDRMRDVWAKRRQRRADKEAAAAEQAAADQNTTQPDAPIATTVNRPTYTPSTFTPAASNGGTMSGHHFTASAMEMARAAAAYEPTGMLQVGQDFAGLQEALQLVAEAMKITTEKADGEQPLAPQVVDLMRGIYQLQQKAAEMAAELVPAFENLHHVDLTRLRNPRNGEHMWDFTTNQA
jgi:hypothetical protein